MATRINIIIKIDHLIEMIQPILQKHEVRIFIRRYTSEKEMHIEPYQDKDRGNLGTDPEYKDFFLFSQKIDFSKVKNFYGESVSPYAIECKGGRYNDREVEVVEMRAISKTPDKTIKSVLTDLNSFFKKNEAFGMGILPLDNSINKNTYYFKADIQRAIVWRYFDKKEFYEPIQVA